MTWFFTICVIISSVLMASVFFLLTIKDNDVFYSYFRWSWLFYSAGFAAVIATSYLDFQYLLVLKAVFDMISLLTFLFAIYHLFHVQIPDSWVKWTVFTALWVAIATYLRLDIFIICVPMALYDLAMTCFICYTVLVHFHKSAMANLTTLVLLFLYGAFKVCFAIVPSEYTNLENAFTLEFFYTIIFTVFISLFYSMYIKKTLSYTEARFQMMIENSRDAFFHCTLKPKMQFEYMTPSVFNILGYNANEFYVQPGLMTTIMQGDYADTVKQVFWDSDRMEFPRTDTVKCIAKNGEIKDIELYFSALTDSDGNISGLNGSIRDVTQFQTVQRNLMDAKAAKERMFSYVSHELKTPITSILGYATALKDGTYTTDTEKERAVEVIIDKALFTKRMIEDLSQLSKLETNQYEFTYELLSCSELASRIRRSTITELENSKIKFRYQIEYVKLSEYSVIADSIRICQVALNLVTNSIRYTRNRNVITVKCDIDKSRTCMVITVSDKGTGIASEDLGYIFNRFFKAEHSSTSQGRGLGLAIAKEIVDAHSGDISVKSRYGYGSTFTVTLPLYTEQ